jgi:hypothetical protein
MYFLKNSSIELPNPERSVARDDDSSTAAGSIIFHPGPVMPAVSLFKMLICFCHGFAEKFLNH